MKPKRRNYKAPPVYTKCIFCGSFPLTDTHIWPRWLRKHLPRQPNYDLVFEEAIPVSPAKTFSVERSQKIKRDIFNQDPKLTCETCNTGWMKRFEDEILTFVLPIIDGIYLQELTKDQQNILSGWIALIITLAEYAKNHRPTISYEELMHLKTTRLPPSNWRIFIGNCTGPRWLKWYAYHSVGLFPIRYEIPFGTDGRPAYNTQITTIGIGHLLVHAFICPAESHVTSFEFAARAMGLNQLWPIEFAFWPFAERRVQFPLSEIFLDEEADEIANAFHDRLVGSGKKQKI